MENDLIFDVIVIGAGHAGLSASYYLKQQGLKHIVLEKGKIGESWRSQRWDSFRLNTANKLNVLPGTTSSINQSDNFCTSLNFVTALEDYVAKFDLPVKEDTTVIAIDKPEDSKLFGITAVQNKIEKTYVSKTVIIASGDANKKKIPAFASLISPTIKQLHTSEYRNPHTLPDGAVLVVGSGQSGCQITEDLLDAGRKVYLSTSAVPRVPRRYRGKDIMDWLITTKFMEMKTHEVPDPKMLTMPPPLLSGIGQYGHTISLQYLARKGATLIGSMNRADAENAFFRVDALMHVNFADEFSAMVKATIDKFITQTNTVAPPAEIDDADLPDVKASCASLITELNLEKYNIKTIIWCTGFTADYNYIKLPVLDNEGHPQHQQGIFNIEGLYLLGHHWLRSRKSSLIYGINDDALHIVSTIKKSPAAREAFNKPQPVSIFFDRLPKNQK